MVRSEFLFPSFSPRAFGILISKATQVIYWHNVSLLAVSLNLFG
jgi:hypothetical protein